MSEFKREKDRLAGIVRNSIGQTAVELATNEKFIDGIWGIRDRAESGTLRREDLPGEFEALEERFKITLEMRSHVYELVPDLLDAWDRDLAVQAVDLREAA